MPLLHESNRRGFMKMLAASPLLAQIAAQQFYEKSAAAMGLDPRGNVYSRLGVKTIINCRGTWTYLSGSLQFPEVRDAQAEAGRYFVNMVELQRGVGRRGHGRCHRGLHGRQRSQENLAAPGHHGFEA